MANRTACRLASLGLLLIAALSVGCESYFFLPFAEANLTGSLDPGTATGSVTVDATFVQHPILSRTFTEGSSITAKTYGAADLTRTPLVVDFNRDGRADAVAGYGGEVGVAQILLSDATFESGFRSLTFDARSDWVDLLDVAVADIDQDGYLDLLLATGNGVYYLKHPNPGDPLTPNRSTTDLRFWGGGNPSVSTELLEGTATTLSDDELTEIIAQTVGPLVNLDDYIVTVEQGYTDIEVGDMDNDGDPDVAASRRFVINLSPRPGLDALEPIQIVNGSVQVLSNPGGAKDGGGWSATSVGSHERQQAGLDRYEPRGLQLVDMDRDGDLDIVSSDLTDNNVQVAWFQNLFINFCPDPFSIDVDWPQWRIGSVRDAFAVEIVDVTGDGYPDVLATGRSQQQLILFEHPGVGFCDAGTGLPNARYEFDWDTYPIATFVSFEPLDLKAFDIDRDGTIELVVGGTNGALRYFEPPADPRSAWEALVITDFEAEDTPTGDVGLLGFADIDGDRDLDIFTVVNTEEANDERVGWVENRLN